MAVGKNIGVLGEVMAYPEELDVYRDRTFALDDVDGYWHFFRMAWHVLERRKLREGWYMKFICRQLQKEVDRIARGEAKTKDWIICQPPRTSKSSIVTVFLNAWAWTKYPHLKFITCSYSSGLSESHSRKTKKILESEWFLKRWGDKVMHPFNGVEHEIGGCRLQGKVTEMLYETSAGGERRASSVGGTLTGEGADIVIGDDLTSVKEGASKADRKAAVRFYRETMYNRLDDSLTGVRVLVQQRVNVDDVVGVELKEHRDMYHLINLPAEIIKGADVQPKRLVKLYEDGLLDAKRFPKSELLKFERVMHDYQEQYIQNPKKAGSNIWLKEWFFEWTWEELLRKVELSGERLVWHFEFDGAFTKKKSNCPTVVLAYCVIGNRAYIRAIFRKWLSFTDLIQELKAFCLKNGYNDESELRIEPKANGLDVIDAMVEYMGINAIASYSPTIDKETAASVVSPVLKAGRIGLLKDIEGGKEYFDEVEMFPQGEFADQVDCTVMVVNNGLGGMMSGVIA